MESFLFWYPAGRVQTRPRSFAKSRSRAGSPRRKNDRWHAFPPPLYIPPNSVTKVIWQPLRETSKMVGLFERGPEIAS